MRLNLVKLACSLLALASLASCSTGTAVQNDQPGQATVGRGVIMGLPLPPNFPHETTVMQTIVAEFDGNKMAFEAVLELSPGLVTVTIVAPSGPRLTTIKWSDAGVVSDKSAQMPSQIRSENLLADMMIALWPAAAVQSALPTGASVTDSQDGTRIVSFGNRKLIDVKSETGSGILRRTLHNHDFGYTLKIIQTAEE